MKYGFKKLLSVLVVIIGAYMMFNYAWPSPPALSGLAFILIAIGQCA